MTDGDPSEGPADKGARARRLLGWARRAYVVVLAAVLVVAVVSSREALADLVREARPALLLLCLLASFGQLALTSAVWRAGLSALGSPVGFGVVLSTTAAAAPSRYLPGSIWYAMARGAALRRRGLPVRSLTAVATMETALVPVVGFALGGALLTLSAALHDQALAAAPGLSWLLVVVCLALLLLASPPVVNRLLRLRAGDTAPPVLGWLGLLRVVAWVAAFWLWAASVFALYLAAFPGAADAPTLTVIAAYMIAWGAGWLALFAPQGVGVFEVTLAALLAGGATELAIVVAGYRALILVRDLSGAALAGVLARRATVDEAHQPS